MEDKVGAKKMGKEKVIKSIVLTDKGARQFIKTMEAKPLGKSSELYKAPSEHRKRYLNK